VLPLHTEEGYHLSVNLQDYRAQLSFRFIEPQTRLPKGYGEFAKWLRKLGIPMDVLNTRPPPIQANRWRALRHLCSIPRMSTIAIGALINWAVAKMPEEQAFVNVGVWNGFTFLAGLAGNTARTAVGVDNFSSVAAPRDAFLARFNSRKTPRQHFYEMDYRVYFRTVHRGPIGFYIYDGEHSYQSQLEGLCLADPFLAPGSLALIDDTNRVEARQATLDFAEQNRQRFRIVLDEPTSRNGHPTFWNGIMVLEKAAPTTP
jgi:hypothetical protein